VNQGAVGQGRARMSPDASRASASAPTVSRSAPAAAAGLAAAGVAPSRLSPGTPYSGAALAPGRQRARPSQIPVASAEKDSADGLRHTSPVLDVVGKGGGQPLDPEVRAEMEDRLGADFSGVRIHTGDQAAGSAAAISAKAYTVGHDVVFGKGAFDPVSREGKRTLAHELTHVQQQRRGPVSGIDTGRGVAVSHPSDAFEQEAEVTASRVLSGPQPVNDVNAERLSVSSTESPERRAAKVSGSATPTLKVVSQSTLKLDSAPIQRATEGNDEDQEDPGERSRQSRPRNAPTGTRPIDQTDLDRETIHKIKDGVGAGPKDWVGVTPDGDVVTTDPDGNAEVHGHASDYQRNGAENIPKWVWAAIVAACGFAAMIAIFVLFSTGIGEVGLILAGAGAVVVFIVRSALRAAGAGSQSIAAGGGSGEGEESKQA
jgi:Domain of unknown function (DUF4157)